MNEEEYLKERVEDQIKWYSTKSGHNQKWYKCLQLLQIISASLIPFLSAMPNIPYSNWFTALLGVIIAISAGSSSLFKYHEKWMEYRSSSEALKQEKILYLTQVAPYDGDDRFQKLVARVEDIMSSENSSWLKYTNKTKN